MSLKPGQFTETCVASNDQYQFKLSRGLGNQDWILRGFRDTVPSSETKDDIGTGREQAREYLTNCTRAFLSNGYFALDQLESLPGFTKLPVGTPPVANREAYEFSYETKARRSPQMLRSTCRVEVDANFHSLPCSVVQTLPGATGLEKWTWSRDWVQVDPQTFTVTEKTLYSFEPSGKNDRTTSQSVAIMSVSLAPMSDSDFRLTAFGLPEPGGVRSTPLYIWMLGGAAVCFALYALFRFLASRKRPA